MHIAIDGRSAIGKKAGIGTYFFNLTKHIPSDGSGNTYSIYLNKNSEIITDRDRIDVKIFRLPAFLWHLRVLYDLYKTSADVYYTPSLIIPQIKITKYVLFIPDMTPFVLPQHHTFKILFLRVLYKTAFKNAQNIITDSMSAKADILKYFRNIIKEEQIVVIPLAASESFKKISDNNYLHKIRVKFKLPDKYILFVGSIEPRKNLIGLLKAFCSIRSGIEHKIVITGAKGWKNAQFYKFIKSNSLENDIIFTDYVDDEELPAIYNMADVFVYPSFYEGFGIPVLEAMRSGIPVIASSTSSLPEIVQNTGILINPNNANEIAQALIKVLSDREFRDALIEKGTMRAKSFNWRDTARLTLDVINKS
jgi:glycosyltransferase involved in cell wall biosynthesis